MAALVFNADAHEYRLDGQLVTHTTRVLDRAGAVDFSHIPPTIRERALVRGRVVHQALHYLNEGDLDLDAFARDFPQWIGYVDAWQFFRAARSFAPILCEHRVASYRHQIAGTLDCLGLLDGRPVLLDFATGDPADSAKDLQTAAYYLMALEWQAHDPALRQFFDAHGTTLQRYAVALRADGTFSIEHYSAATDTRHFLALLEAQRIIDARRAARREVLT